MSNEDKLVERAAKIGGAQHLLLLDYGFTVVKVTENTAVYLDESDGYQITLDAVGHWWIKPEGDREFKGIGFVDLEAVLSPSGR
jgi:hypothetical protein